MKRCFVGGFGAMLLGLSFLVFGTGGAMASRSLAPIPGCSYSACAHEVLTLINADRAASGLRPLKLTGVQSRGTSSCSGSYGHSVAMAESGQIWHANSQFPQASFPQNICVHFHEVAENVGMFDSGNVLNDLRTINNLMWGEPHNSATCATTVNHACNMINPAFNKVGIGIFVSHGSTWLTEDFSG